jgi:hypothetical protein
LSPAATTPSAFYHKNGLDLPDECTLEDAGKIADTLADMRELNPWAMGDWVNQVESRWPQMHSQIVERLRVKPETYGNYARVAAAIPRPLRREALSFSIHAVCYSRDDAGDWLDRAEKEGWTVVQLREAIHGPIEKTMCTCPSCGKEHRKAKP